MNNPWLAINQLQESHTQTRIEMALLGERQKGHETRISKLEARKPAGPGLFKFLGERTAFWMGFAVVVLLLFINLPHETRRDLIDAAKVFTGRK